MRAPRVRLWLTAAALLLALQCLDTAAAPAVPGPSREDPALRQRLDRDQAVAGGRKVLTTGHVDVGPKFVDGRWTVMIHDDTARSITGGPSVWRRPEPTVLKVADAAIREVPDDPTYSFLHADPGTEVYVVPETQKSDVVWVGWNTQDPEVMERVDRGAKMTLTGVQGPGSLVVYLQSGDFSEPQILWDSTAEPQPIWVDVNTHTHANWVFSRPGVYLVRIRIEADLIDGRKALDERDLRFAVGSRTSVDDAIAAVWKGPVPGGGAVANDADASAPEADEGGGTPLGLIVAVAVVAAGLVGALALIVVRGNRAKRLARERSGGRSPRKDRG